MTVACKAPFLILETGQPVASMRRHGRFPHWIRVAAALGADEAVVANVEGGDRLPRREGFAGVIVTGSAAYVTERAEWSERSARWLHEAAHAGLPVLGICYGHQLLAHALGGEVADNPAGRESGTIHVDLQPPASADPLFSRMPPRFVAQSSHVQTVLRPPSGSAVLASSERDGCQAFRWGERAWGVQFHPEFATRHMRGYVAARREALHRDGRCARSIAREVTAAPHSRKLLRRFVTHARGLHAR